MPYIFSEQQIERAHHLIAFHNMDAEQIADIMNTSIVSARHLIKLAQKNYPELKHKIQHEQPKKILSKKQTEPVKIKPIAFVRPKAEYSNRRIYDLI